MGMVRELVASEACDNFQELLITGTKYSDPVYEFCCRHILPEYLKYYEEACPLPDPNLHGQILILYKQALEELDGREREVAQLLGGPQVHYAAPHAGSSKV